MQRDSDKTTAALENRSGELPVVIRPRPLRLAELERRLRADFRLAAALAEQPTFCATLAGVLFARDAEARSRFADVDALAAHLRAARCG
jgi:hypothetical protein